MGEAEEVKNAESCERSDIFLKTGVVALCVPPAAAHGSQLPPPSFELLTCGFEQ